MEASLFRKFREIVYSEAGIALNDQKLSLVEARLSKRLRALQLNSLNEYLYLLETDETGKELIQFVDAISTNYTHFMREPDHFDLLEKEAKKWLVEGRKRIRLWCAAASGGEEPYSMAMTLNVVMEDEEVDWKILATDISTKMLLRASRAVYDEDALKPLTNVQLKRFFKREQSDKDKEKVFRVAETIRDKVFFKRLNLSAPPFPMKGPLDMIFCRNVMIYFDHTVRRRLIAEIERLLMPGGLLITGHSETLNNTDSTLKVVVPSVYMKPT